TLTYKSDQNKWISRHCYVKTGLLPNLPSDSLGETFPYLKPSRWANPLAMPETSSLYFGMLDQQDSAFPIENYACDRDRNFLFVFCAQLHLNLPAEGIIDFS